MSFISIQNFLEPFRRKVHLISISMVAILFLVFRLHGGGMTLQRVTVEERPASSLFERSEKVAPRPVPNRPQSSIFNDVVAPRKAAPSPSESPKREQTPDRSGLDDIERSLGLR